MKKLNKTQKVIAISLSAFLGLGVIAGGVIGGIAIYNYICEQKYQNGLTHLVNRDHKVAYDIFTSIPNYKDSLKKQDYSYQLYRIDEGDYNYESIIDEIVRYKGTANIYFDSNGGTNVPPRTITERVRDGKYITETSFKSYEDFTGWNLTYGKYVKDTDSVFLKLDAQYSHHNYSISYNLNGGSISEDAPLHFTYYSNPITLPQPVKAGYNFTGYTSASESEPQLNYVIPSHTHNDVEVTANYNAKTIHVNFDADGGECDTPSGDYVYMSDVSESIPTATKEFYDFAGWYWNDNPVDLTAFNVSEDNATLVAHYTAKSYYIYYHNMVQVTPLEELPNSFTYDDPDLRIPFVHKDGYLFCGWKVKDSSDTPDIYYSIPHNTSSDVYLEPVWLEYTDGGTGNVLQDVTRDYPFLNSLKNIVIPENIKFINEIVLTSCFRALWDVDSEPGSVFTNVDHLLTKKSYGNNIEIVYAPHGRFESSVEELTLPGNVDRICKSAFLGCGVKYINANKNLNYIENEAFRESDLVEIRNADLKEIGNYAFTSCKDFNNYTLLHNFNLRSIGDYAFLDCDSLTEVKFTNVLTNIGKESFSYSGLRKIIFNVSKTATIGTDIFKGSNDLTEIIGYMDTLDVLLEQIDYNKANIKYIQLLGSGELPSELFSGYSSLQTVSFQGATFHDLSEKCFYETTSLDQATLPGSMTTIKKKAFYNSGIKHVYFEDASSLRKIEDQAFMNSGLTSIDLHEAKYLTLGEDVFKNCTDLEEVSLFYDTVDNIPGAFENCLNIRKVSIYFDEFSSLSDLDDSFFINMKALEEVEFVYVSKEDLGTKKSLIIPRACFSGCEALETISLYNIEIGAVSEYSFENCRSYTNAEGYFSNLVSYPRGSFFGCTQLSLTLTGTEEIGRYAFVSCNNLGDLFIPKTVVKVGVEAFGYTSGTNTNLKIEFTPEELAPYLLEDGGWYHWDMNCFCSITYGATL